MMNGFIRTVSQKNFGFIRTESGADYFFHKDDFNGFWNDLLNDFEDAEKHKEKIYVTFEPGKGEKGPRASEVTRTDHPNQ